MADTLKTLPGESIGRYLRRTGRLSAASRLGVQKKGNRSWMPISMSYVVQKGDVIRIAEAAGSSDRSAGALKSLIQTLAFAQDMS